MSISNIELDQAIETLRSRLPPRWSADLNPGPNLRIAAPDGRVARLRLEVRERLDPRRAGQVVASAARGSLVVSPWMSPETRALLVDAGMHALDLTGGLRLSLDEPGLFIEAPSADRDPSPDPARVTLRGARAAAVVVALCQVSVPVGVRQLAGLAGATPGYVSKLLGALEGRGVERTARGGVAAVDRLALLEAWAADAPLERRARATHWEPTRGLPDFLLRLSRIEATYAITGHLGAWLATGGRPPRTAAIYATAPAALAAATGLRSAAPGATVRLLVTKDPGVFVGTWKEDGLAVASLPRVAADLTSAGERDSLRALLSKVPAR